MLHFLPLEEAQAAVYAIRNARVDERMFDGPRLRVAAIQHCDLAARRARIDKHLDFLDDPARFLRIRRGFVDAHLLAVARVGAQVLAEPPRVVGDQEIRRIENMAVRAIILLQLDEIAHAEFALEIVHIADVGAAERVDRLVVVADREDRVVFAGEHLEPRILQFVGVLKLVDQNVAETRLIVRAQRRVERQQFEAAQQQFREVHHAFALALLVVRLVQFDELAVEVVGGVDILRTQALLLRVVDEVLKVLGRILLVVDFQPFHQPLDGRKLVGRVENLEGLRQAGIAVMRAQHPVAQGVEGADPHAARIDRQQRGQARHHFARGLVRKRDGEHGRRRCKTLLDQPRDAGNEHARLAAASAREDQRGFVGQRHGGELFGIQIGEQVGHGEIGRGQCGRRAAHYKTALIAAFGRGKPLADPPMACRIVR